MLFYAVLVDRWAMLQHSWRRRRGRRRLGAAAADVEAASGGNMQQEQDEEEQEALLLADLAGSTTIPLLHSDAERREFISAGAAAGLAVRAPP